MKGLLLLNHDPFLKSGDKNVDEEVFESVLDSLFLSYHVNTSKFAKILIIDE